MVGITKSYPGVEALRGVDFDVLPGEVHALVGENGAGKSTLMKILAGAEPHEAGEIHLDGKLVRALSPQKALELGVGIIYQEFSLAPYLSAAENIFLGREPRASFPGFIDRRKLVADAQRHLDGLGASIDARRPVAALSLAQRQMVEIAKATSHRVKVLAMDEPSATLTQHEMEALFRLIESLKSQSVGIVFVSHRLDEVQRLSDRVTVLRDGRRIGTWPRAGVTRDEIVRSMVGRELKEAIPKAAAPVGPPLLEVRGLSRKRGLRNVSLQVRRGEVVALAGLVGAGRSELALAIFGADRFDAGEILVDGRPVKIKSPRAAIARGIGMVTEDRKQLGLVLPMNVRENVSLASLRRVSALGFVRRSREREAARRYIKELAIKTPGPEQPVRNLSGGNQQKVVLAKWLFTQSRILLLDEPTRGVDVGAKAEIYQLINRLAAQGAGILMISSELPEVLAMADRILVMHEGRIAGELSRAEASQERIMHLATGGE